MIGKMGKTVLGKFGFQTFPVSGMYRQDDLSFLRGYAAQDDTGARKSGLLSACTAAAEQEEGEEQKKTREKFPPVDADISAHGIRKRRVRIFAMTEDITAEIKAGVYGGVERPQTFCGGAEKFFPVHFDHLTVVKFAEVGSTNSINQIRGNDKKKTGVLQKRFFAAWDGARSRILAKKGDADMKQPMPMWFRYLSLSFLLTALALFCTLPVSYPRQTFPHAKSRTHHIGDAGSREEIHHAREEDTEDLLTRLWREELEKNPGETSLTGF